MFSFFTGGHGKFNKGVDACQKKNTVHWMILYCWWKGLLVDFEIYTYVNSLNFETYLWNEPNDSVGYFWLIIVTSMSVLSPWLVLMVPVLFFATVFLTGWLLPSTAWENVVLPWSKGIMSWKHTSWISCRDPQGSKPTHPKRNEGFGPPLFEVPNFFREERCLPKKGLVRGFFFGN